MISLKDWQPYRCRSIAMLYFDGDFNSEMQHAIWFPNAGLDLEYDFNPVWGLGLSYMFSRYGVTGLPGFDNADKLLEGYMHKAGLYVSMDFMNLFFPRAKKKIFSANAIVGGGYAWYKSTTYFPDDDAHGRGHTAQQTPMAMDKYNGQLYLQAIDKHLTRQVCAFVALIDSGLDITAVTRHTTHA